MSKHSKEQLIRHQALAAFSLWSRYGLRTSIENVNILRKINPVGIKNPILTFAIPRAMDHIVERFVLEVVQAWEILNKELKVQRKRTLGVSNKDYMHLKRIRNKLVAHKIENSLKTKRYEKWYKKSYGNYTSVLSLVQRAAEKISDRIDMLNYSGDLEYNNAISRGPVPITEEDVRRLLTVLKNNGIY